MKISVKLITGFFIIALLVGFVGYFSFVSSNTIQKNGQLIIEILELENLLDDSLVQVLQLIETQNLDDYYATKSNIENLRKEFDILHEKNDEIMREILDESTFHEDIDQFIIISNGIIAVHKDNLIQNREFVEKYALEKDLRYKIRASLTALKDAELRGDIAFMEYYSKETIFQYRNKEKLDIWLESIEKVKNRAEQLNPQQNQKNILLQDIDLYKKIAQRIGEIVIEQKEIEADERLKIVQLTDIIDRLEEDEARIVNSLKIENESLIKNTYLTLLTVIMASFIASIGLGLYISNSISKPIQKLTESARKIKQGNLNVKCEVKSKDEIGELAETFEDMRLGLKDRNDLLNSLLNTFKGKFGSIATILVRKNVHELVNKNPRIEKILPKSLGMSITRAKKLERESARKTN